MHKSLAAVCIACGIMAPVTSLAEPISGRAADVFNSRASLMISAAKADTADSQAYVAGLKSTCSGLISDLMSAHMPNSAGIQLQSFCMGVTDLERAIQANKSGHNAYCGDFDQGIKAARRMPQTPDTQAIYATAQDLAAAAEQIKAAQFQSGKHVGWNLSAEIRSQTMSCR